MSTSKMIKKDVSSNIDNNQPISQIISKGNLSMNTSLSSLFVSKLERLTGKMTEIGHPVANGDKTTWLMFHANTSPNAKLTIIQPAYGENVGYDEALFWLEDEFKILNHIANGDFDTWTINKHLVVRSFASNGYGVANNKETLIKNTDGDFGTMVTKNGKDTFVTCEKTQNSYHQKVNLFLDGGNVAIYVSQLSSVQAVFSTMFNTLFLGAGNVIPAVASIIEASKVRKEVFNVKKIFIENGEGDKVGYVAKAPKLMVPSYDGTMVDFYTIAEGTKFDIMLDDERQGGDVWDPSNEGTLLALRLIANGKYQTVKVL